MVVEKPLGDRMWREEEEGHAFVESCSTSSGGSGQRNIMVRGWWWYPWRRSITISGQEGSWWLEWWLESCRVI